VAKPPDWKDEAGLTNFVSQAITDLLNDPQSKHEYGLDVWPFEYDGPRIVTWEMLESEAVAAAKDGNYDPLAQLLDPGHPLNNPPNDPPIRAALAPSTYALIADILRGRRKKPERRPKLTESQRRKLNPIHDAADEVPVVERMLRAWYPKRTTREIHRRALYVVARRHNVWSKTLNTYLRRPPDDHRRPTSHPKRTSRRTP
jgi:hypothetical protein